jgi:lipopolysaccharide cholinephosphotransferase
MYGDYMTMPPVERRKTHYPYQLDFGPYDLKEE